MMNINNIEIITREIPNWAPNNIYLICDVFLTSNSDLKIRFLSQIRNKGKKWPDLSIDFDELVILFKNISSLKFELNGRAPYQVMGFDIIDITDNGYENINFQIEDYENNSIGFYCGEIYIESIKNFGKMTGQSQIGFTYNW